MKEWTRNERLNERTKNDNAAQQRLLNYANRISFLLRDLTSFDWVEHRTKIPASSLSGSVFLWLVGRSVCHLAVYFIQLLFTDMHVATTRDVEENCARQINWIVRSYDLPDIKTFTVTDSDISNRHVQCTHTHTLANARTKKSSSVTKLIYALAAPV